MLPPPVRWKSRHGVTNHLIYGAMIDLHMHSIFSDGVLVPAEIARRTEAIGCRYIAITDHVDISNVEHVTESIVRFAENNGHTVKVIPGVEVTHVEPSGIARVIDMARKGGARIVLVHGETIVEPVMEGTDEAAIDAGADILAHPGLISSELAKKAADAGVALEISARRSHFFANGHIARMALESGAEMVLNSDAHAPGDFIDLPMALKVLQGSGLTLEQSKKVLSYSEKLAEAACGTV